MFRAPMRFRTLWPLAAAAALSFLTLSGCAKSAPAVKYESPAEEDYVLGVADLEDRDFAKAQKVIMFFGLGGAVVIGIVLTVTSRAAFTDKWNAWIDVNATDMADGVDKASLHYDKFAGTVATVGEIAGGIPTTWNWRDTIGLLVAASWLYAYAYSISFIAGEVKRPDKSIIWANVFAILVPCTFMLWFGLALYHSVGFQFLSASTQTDAMNGSGVVVATFPWDTSFIGLAAIMVGTGAFAKVIMAIMALSYVAFAIWLVTLSYLAFPRIMFAWGMDRMGPKWFTDINPRYASPVKNILLAFIIGEALLLWAALKPDASVNIALTGLQITSVFFVTALAALLFPYMKGPKSIWDSSPYKKWTLLGVPVIVWGAIVNIIYLGVLMYGLFPTKWGGLGAGGDWTFEMIYMMIAAWVLGIAWFFFWKQKSKSVGVDVSVTYGELPPD